MDTTKSTKYPLPISIPKGLKPTITQPYGDKSNIAWYIANGLNLSEHNGTDFIIGDSIQTYGTRLVCSIPSAYLSKSWWNNPMSTSGNGIQFSWDEGSDGYSARCWHTSQNVIQPIYKEKDTIGFIGNSGLVRPPPTPQMPFNGSHLHLMVYKNGVLIDPMTIFDETKWFISEDTGVEKDLPPLFWALEYAKSQLKILTNKVALWLKK